MFASVVSTAAVAAANGEIDSPHSERFAQLAQKLEGLQTEDQKKKRAARIDERIQSIVDELDDYTLHDSLAPLENKVSNMDKEMSAMSSWADAAWDGALSLSSKFKERTKAVVDGERAARLEGEKKATNRTAELLVAVQAEIAALRRKREKEEQIIQTAGEELPMLRQKLKSMEEEREEMEAKLLHTLQEHLDELNDIIDQERAEREEMEEAILRVLEEVLGRLQTELSEEREARAAGEESISQLMEHTLRKFSESRAVL
eukprot:Rmarinus@m.13266